MQEPTEVDEPPVPTAEAVSSDPNMNRTVVVCRKAAKRTLPFDLAAGELLLVSHIPARKKPRLEKPLPTTTDEAASKTASHDVSVGLPPHAAGGDDANVDSVTDTQPNAVATRVNGRWTTDEDAQLTSAITNTCKKKWGNEYKTDWVAVAAMFSDRTNIQCWNRWKDVLDPNIDRGSGRKGKWAEDEDRKLKDAVQTRGDKDWVAVAALVPGRTNRQCWNRWKDVLDPNIDRGSGRKGKRAEDEDSKLKDAVQTHGDKDWVAVAALVPGRTKKLCWSRWYDALNPSIALTILRKGSWTAVEDIKLKDAVQMHGCRNWAAIAALVPGRTTVQCHIRWKDVLDPSIDQVTARMGKWAEEEDIKLKDAVQMHGGKNWGAIAALVPGRVEKQCHNRWQQVLDLSIDQVIGRTGSWTKDEDTNLKDAVQTHGGKNWTAIALLVPGRTISQCRDRWRKILDPSIDRANGHTGRWAKDEDTKLKDAVQTHGGKNWGSIAALVLGRTTKQCYYRWKDVLDPSIDRGSGRKWTVVDDIKLEDAVQTYGGKNWDAIAALVPGRTQHQCCHRWHAFVDPSLGQVRRVNGQHSKSPS
jgi:hypothetical protein